MCTLGISMYPLAVWHNLWQIGPFIDDVSWFTYYCINCDSSYITRGYINIVANRHQPFPTCRMGIAWRPRWRMLRHGDSLLQMDNCTFMHNIFYMYICTCVYAISIYIYVHIPIAICIYLRNYNIYILGALAMILLQECSQCDSCSRMHKTSARGSWQNDRAAVKIPWLPSGYD